MTKLADSCGEHNPLATSFVKMMANALQSEFQQVGQTDGWRMGDPAPSVSFSGDRITVSPVTPPIYKIL